MFGIVVLITYGRLLITVSKVIGTETTSDTAKLVGYSHIITNNLQTCKL